MCHMCASCVQLQGSSKHRNHGLVGFVLCVLCRLRAANAETVVNAVDVNVEDPFSADSA